MKPEWTSLKAIWLRLNLGKKPLLKSTRLWGAKFRDKNKLLIGLHIGIFDWFFPKFSCMFLNPNNFFQFEFLFVKNHQILETSRNKLKKPFCYQKLFWPFTIWINCSRDLKNFANSQPSASNFKSFSQSLEFFSHCRSEQFWQQNTISFGSCQLIHGTLLS